MGLCVVGGLLLVGSAPVLAARYAEPAAIVPADLFADRDIEALDCGLGLEWLPPTREYITTHVAKPDHPDIRPEFAIWAKSLLAPEWLPADLPDSAPYLRSGTHRESRFRSYMYGAYKLDGISFMLKGYLDFIHATIRNPSLQVPASVEAALVEARSLDEARPAGALGVPRRYKSANREIRSHLRALAECYLNPVSLPQSEAAWTEALSHVRTYNGGFWVTWLTDGYSSLVPQPPEKAETVLVVVWTNGRTLRLSIHHNGVWVHSFSHWLETFPKRVVASVAPLNPEAVELWDMRHWKDECGPVSEEDRAVYDMIQVLVKQPYAPNVGIEMSGEWAGGQPWWGNQVRLPMTELKWHIAEFAALLDGTHIHVEHHRYPKTFASELGSASDRAAFLEEAEGHREALAEAVDRFCTLRYPLQVQAERNEMLAALRDGVRVWEIALAFWEPAVQQYPEASEAFYELRGRALEEQLAASGLAGATARMGKAARAAVPLFERFGLQQAAG